MREKFCKEGCKYYKARVPATHWRGQFDGGHGATCKFAEGEVFLGVGFR